MIIYMKKACMFPGQGVQFTGMMKEEYCNKYSKYIKSADDILGYSIVDICNNKDRAQMLNQTEFTQPAMYMVNAFSYFDYIEREGIPEYCIGHSLGEFNAIAAANIVSFEEGLILVKERGNLMSEITNGSMMAILGINRVSVIETINRYGFETIDVANMNSYTQTVIAGPMKDLEEVKKIFELLGATVVFLKVSGPFHTRYMKNAALKFGSVLRKVNVKEASIPVISNYTAKEYISEDTKNNLIKQIYNPVKWVQSIEYLIDQGVDEFTQVGPGRVLKNLYKKIVRDE